MFADKKPAILPFQRFADELYQNFYFFLDLLFLGFHDKKLVLSDNRANIFLLGK